jgi:predicted anti-sigma-YlaC factor YlaD
MSEKPGCEYCVRLLRPFLEGKLEEEKEKAFRDHYAACDTCLEQVFRADASALFSKLRFQEEEAPLAGIWPAIEEEIGKKKRRVLPVFQWVPRYALAAVLAFLLIAVSVYLNWTPVPGTRPARERKTTVLISDRDVIADVITRRHLSRSADLLNPDVTVVDLDYRPKDSDACKLTMFFNKNMEESY